MSQRSTRLRQAVEQVVRFTFADQQSDIDHDFQVPLQRPTVDLWTQTFKALDSQAAVLKLVGPLINTCIKDR